jgi:hypothetical protein
VTFFGQREHEERMLRTLRKMQRRAGLPPLPRYRSPGLPPTWNNVNVRTTK